MPQIVRQARPAAVSDEADIEMEVNEDEEEDYVQPAPSTRKATPVQPRLGILSSPFCHLILLLHVLFINLPLVSGPPATQKTSTVAGFRVLITNLADTVTDGDVKVQF